MRLEVVGEASVLQQMQQSPPPSRSRVWPLGHSW